MMIEIVTIICYNITRMSQIQAEKIKHQGKNNMLEKDQWIIHQADLDRYKGMIRQENRTAFRLMTVTGCVLSIFNLITQIVITGFGSASGLDGWTPSCGMVLTVRKLDEYTASIYEKGPEEPVSPEKGKP